MRESELLDQIRVILPRYLSPQEQADLWAEIRRFPQNRNFYLPEGAIDTELLQGDGWRGFVATEVQRLEQKVVLGLVLSNSCDIEISNERTLLPRLLFAPILTLEGLRQTYVRAGKNEDRTGNFLDTVRRQEVTNMFYLPAGPHGPENESVILLDDVHQQPVRAFLETDRTRMFRLGQFAFWTLLMKLSIHFCRSNEGVVRFPGRRAS